MIKDEYIIPKVGTLEESLATWGRSSGLDQEYRICLFKEDVYFKPPLSDAYRFFIHEKSNSYLIQKGHR
jgi:hypothetical protein